MYAQPTKKQTSVVFLFILAAFFCHNSDATTNDIKPLINRIQDQGSLTSHKAPLSNKQVSQVAGRYLVVLKDGSVVSQLNTDLKSRSTPGKAQKAGRAAINSAKGKKIKQYLNDSQQRFAQSVSTSFPGVTMTRQYQTLLNAVELSISEHEAKTLAQHPQVKAIYPVKIRRVRLDRNHEVIKSVAAWTKLGGMTNAGKGVKIAIIDTGIRNDNPMFDDTGFEPIDLSEHEFLNNNPDYCRSATGMASFCNNKLIVARWIDPVQHDFSVYQNEHFSPLDFDGHGSHVAGIAAGAGVEITFQGADVEIAGVAPASQLLVYKALWVGLDGFASAPDTMLLEALEFAVNDGADVINNSWGGGAGEDPQNSIYQEVFSNAEDMGIVIVNAAGNDLHAGRGQSINCPACIDSGIAVANTTHGRFFGHEAHIDGQTYTLYGGENSGITEDISLTLASLDSVSPLSNDGCEPWVTPFFEQAIVMVDYIHTCTLEEVANNVRSAGGSVALIYQSGAFGMGIFEPFIPHEGEYVIPVVGVSRQTGLALFELAYTRDRTIHISPNVSSSVEPQYSDMQHPFSSTGPNANPGVLKPDISAPGTHILSALSPDEFVFGPFPFPGAAKEELNSDVRFGMLTGTSMASPHVAGAAALLRQQYPDWTAAQIKSALTSSSQTKLRLGAGPATPFGVGAGRLNVERALNTALTFNQVSFADPGCIGRCAFTFDVSNMSDDAGTWDVEFEFDDADVQGNADIVTLNLAKSGLEGDKKSINVEVNTAAVGDSKWVFGALTLNRENNESATLPIAVFANETSDAGSITVTSPSDSQYTSESLVFDVRIRNKNFTHSPTLRIPLPDNIDYLDGSAEVAISRGQSTGLEYRAEQREIIWRGELNKGQMRLAEAQPWGTGTLREASIPPVSCAEGCLHVTAEVEFEFEFNGSRYSSLTISDNGFAVPGVARIGSFAALFNQSFPQAGGLDNVLAPLWTEFDLQDVTDEFDTGGGYLRTAVRTVDERNYLVVEWDRVRLYDNEFDEVESDPFTFQLIIQENTSNIWFNYLEIPSMPATASIGAENVDGSIGINRYFDGQGLSLPQVQNGSAYTLQLTTEPEGLATISAEFSLADNQTFSQEDRVSLDEDSELHIDVLANDQNKSTVVLTADLDAGASFTALKTVRLESEGGLDASTLEISQQAGNGVAEVVDGKIKYTPNVHYHGADSFSYRVADNAGKYSTPTNVSLAIRNLNDVPVLITSQQISADENQSVTLTVEGSDNDNDTLSYQWVQIVGPIVNRALDENNTDNSFSFVTPTVREDTLIAFSVTANDGSATSEPVEVSVLVKNEGGGGSLFGLLIVMGLIGCFRLMVVRQ